MRNQTPQLALLQSQLLLEKSGVHVINVPHKGLKPGWSQGLSWSLCSLFQCPLEGPRSPSSLMPRQLEGPRSPSSLMPRQLEVQPSPSSILPHLLQRHHLVHHLRLPRRRLQHHHLVHHLRLPRRRLQRHHLVHHLRLPRRRLQRYYLVRHDPARGRRHASARLACQATSSMAVSGACQNSLSTETHQTTQGVTSTLPSTTC
ncbi:unnamed protein product [Oreochromis niloticus]|nr:unnamed protein product [Mustela putorius furo]